MIKNISIVVVITVIILWAFSTLMDSALADVTSNGAALDYLEAKLNELKVSQGNPLLN